LCQKCEKEIHTYPSVVKQGRSKYCSRECSDGERIERICKICGKKFTRRLSGMINGRGKFCSRPCYTKDWNKRIPGWNKGKPASWAIGNKWRLGMKSPHLIKLGKEHIHELYKIFNRLMTIRVRSITIQSEHFVNIRCARQVFQKPVRNCFAKRSRSRESMYC